MDHGVGIGPDMDSPIWDLQMLSKPGRRELIWMCFQKEGVLHCLMSTDQAVGEVAMDRLG